MENLFARHKPKRGVVGLMLAGSLVLHGGLVGIASLWTPPEPDIHTVVIDEISDAPPVGPGPIKEASLPANPPEAPVVTATPEAVDPVVLPPPLAEDLLMTESSEQTPLPHRPLTARSMVSANHPTGAPASSRASTGLAGNGTPGNGGPAGTTGVWLMPHPPYPRAVHFSPGVGATTVRITTDATGQVSNVVIVRSTGNPILDSNTTSYVRNNWHGPPNASRTTEFVYQLK